MPRRRTIIEIQRYRLLPPQRGPIATKVITLVLDDRYDSRYTCLAYSP